MSIPNPVSVRRESIELPTYFPAAPDRNPMFLEKRVYQGSSGRVYPLPFTDRIAEKPQLHRWDAVWIENDYLRVLILPELGGRIHRAQDKTNGFDFIYYQPVIKPALVGLAGPWASGGIEFNWPQHHRPSTFMPADVAIEQGKDSVTVWLSEHDPMARMKGMHGVRLHAGRALLELVVRTYNRTCDVQTFLWWSNVGVRVHEAYQSFFPPDVAWVADHAKRATSSFPLCEGRYYGVDYGSRARQGVPPNEAPRQYPPRTSVRNGATASANDHAVTLPTYAPNDLTWYANIPVPTSYMCMGSTEDFAGGYDHRAQAGFVQVANHHISPGKKQWTWGNHEFGYAWDRNLTDPDSSGEYRPYIELMSGVYTDNQPDFSYLQPGETKTWSQFWYPIQAIGPAQKANAEAALTLRIIRGTARIGVATTAVHRDAQIRLLQSRRTVHTAIQTLAPRQPWVAEVTVDASVPESEFTLVAETKDGRELIRYTPCSRRTPQSPPAPAVAPPKPAELASADELFFTGLHLEQYRHATRAADTYWREALRRDPGDARCNLALGRWHLRRGEFDSAEMHLRASIARSVSRNPNPADGEPFYQLGLCLRHKAFAAKLDPALLEEAYAQFYKATWSHAWQSAGFHALAEIDALRQRWTEAHEHLDRALRLNADNLRARNLKAIALRQLGRISEAAEVIRGTLALDPLDWWARALQGDPLACDMQVRFDLALDCARAGLFREALAILDDPAAKSSGPTPTAAQRRRLPDASLGSGPMLHYYRAWLAHLTQDRRRERRHLAAAQKIAPDYCFPARLEEIAILEHAMAAAPQDARAPFFLGNLLYDRRRHREAIALWEEAVAREPGNAVAWRNLGIAYCNILHQPGKARANYERAFRANPRDARLHYERDQLWKRLGDSPARRLRELRRHPQLVRQRDDLSIELCTLYNQTRAPRQALKILSSRRFQPWEGGEGLALAQHARAHAALGRDALRKKNPAAAVAHFSAALTAPENLGEARHLLANQSDLHYWHGCALAESGDLAAARKAWTTAAEFQGDFQGMSVRAFSEMTFYSALALQKLGRTDQARRLLQRLLRHARQLARSPADIDYFATSLPTMLLFDDDLQARQRTTALFLEAQARLGLGQAAVGRQLLREVLQRDPNHSLASDLLAESKRRNR